MDAEARQLSEQVARKVKRGYVTRLRRGQGMDEAFAASYEEAVHLVAHARHMSVEKTKFFSGDVLQAVMKLVTR